MERLRKRLKRRRSINRIGKWRITCTVEGRLNVSYCSEEFRSLALQCWSSSGSSSDSDVSAIKLAADQGLTCINKPFSCFHMRTFVDNEDFLKGLKVELQSLKFEDKSNDLYKFRQSEDLREVGTPAVASLARFLYDEFREWVVWVTGISLNATVDMSCAQYRKTGEW